jgi:hypothetical protein
MVKRSFKVANGSCYCQTTGNVKYAEVAARMRKRADPCLQVSRAAVPLSDCGLTTRAFCGRPSSHREIRFHMTVNESREPTASPEGNAETVRRVGRNKSP